MLVRGNLLEIMKTIHLFVLLFCGISLVAQQKTIENFYLQGDYNQVIEQANQKITKQKANFNTWYFKGFAENALFKYVDAAQSFEQALSIKPADNRVKLALARAYNNQGIIQKSIALYTQIIAADSTQVPALSNLAKIYRNNHEYVKAADLFTQLVTIDTTNGYFYSQLAYCCHKMGYQMPVITYYEKAISLNSDDYTSVKALVSEIIAQKYYEKATQYIDSFLLTFTNDIYLLKQKAYVSALSGRTLAAVQEFEKVVAMGDTSLFTCKYYGQSLYNNAQFDLAVIWLDKYLDKKPDDFQNQLIMGLACQQDYQYERSLKHLKIAYFLKYDPKMLSRIVSEKAKTQIKYGDYLGYRDSTPTNAHSLYMQAKDNFIKALEFYPDGYNFYKDLGVLYETKLHDTKLALYFYKKYYEALDPKEIDVYTLDWIQRKIETLKEKAHFMVD